MQDRTTATPDRVTAEQVLAELRDQVTDQLPLLQKIADKPSADYTPTLGAMTKTLNGIEGSVSAVGTQLGTVVTREEYARVTEAAVERGVAAALRQQDAERERKDAERQWLKARQPPPKRLFGQRWLPPVPRLPRKGQVAVAAFWIAAGFALFPFLGSVLPISLGSHMAAATIGTVNRSQAGSDIMSADQPENWIRIATQAKLIDDNKASVEECQKRATETRRTQKCSILVAPQ